MRQELNKSAAKKGAGPNNDLWRLWHLWHPWYLWHPWRLWHCSILWPQFEQSPMPLLPLLLGLRVMELSATNFKLAHGKREQTVNKN